MLVGTVEKTSRVSWQKVFGTSASGQYGVSGEACPSLLLAGGWAGPWGEACAGKNDGGCHYLG